MKCYRSLFSVVFRFILSLTVVGCASSASGPSPAAVRSESANVTPIEHREFQTDAGGESQAYWSAQSSAPHLMITIGGTYSKTSEMVGFDRTAAEHGYRVIDLAYANGVITTECAPFRWAQACFDQFRAALVEGRPMSLLPAVVVDRAHSIEHRILEALIFLAAADAERWSVFLREGKVDWSRVTVAGHSQGAGHAAYLAKKHALERVILFGGPQDFVASANRPAAWTTRHGKTPAARFFALLHQDDEYDVNKQQLVFKALTGGHAAPGQPVVLTRSVAPRSAHLALVSRQLRDEWPQLLNDFSNTSN